jgi:hypothetical protein
MREHFPAVSSMPTTAWPILGPDVPSILDAETDPIGRLADGDVAALVVRQAFNREECAALVEFLIAKELMFADGDERIDARAIPVQRVDRWTRQGLNPAESKRRRIDIGASLGNIGDDRENFLRHSAETHDLFSQLFSDRPNPVDAIYRNLAQLSPGKRVATAYEPDGRKYGPAIFRIHYGGYTYGPHFDSVRQRENRRSYSVYKYARQLAGVLCIQNATRAGQTAQCILHRQFWNEEIDPLLSAGEFHQYAAENNVDNVRVDLEPGDLYFFNTGMIHEVPGVEGDLPRIVLATFIGYSRDDDEIMVWS